MDVGSVLVATRKGLFQVARQIGGWRSSAPAFLGEPVTAVLHDRRDGTLYAALRLGHFGVKLHRSDDGGKSWWELPAPAFPPAADDNAAAPAVDLIWTLEAGGTDEPGRLWAGTLPGGLFTSTDRGETWRLVESLWNRPERAQWVGGGYDHPGIHSILVDPRDSRRLTIGVSVGGVWTSEDRGESWALVGQGLRADYLPPDKAYDGLVQDPHRLAHCRAAPDAVWCQHHNGMFRSGDGGRSFVEFKGVKPAVFGFAVAAHPTDPLTAWFVPGIKDEQRVPVDGALVVVRTRDGGRSFEQLTHGLPRRDCWDLVYRHALDVDAAGSCLCMGSTTGNLWLGEQSGESWSLVTTHLPPIAQVAFA